MAELIDILAQAEQLFFKYGIKSISMDDLSREMRISKKTLYTFVANKDELVLKVMENHLDKERRKVEITIKEAENSIQEFVLMLMYNYYQINEINTSTLFDVQKYYPNCWALFTEYKEKYIYNYVIHNIKKGMEEGLYRPELNPELIALFYINSVDAIIRVCTEKQDKNTISDMLREYVNYHLHGVVSEKGKEYLSNYLNKIK